MPSMRSPTFNRYTSIALCLLSLGGIFQSHLYAENFTPTQQELNHIPAHEQFILERFFQILVASDGLGYTLFGSKPICLSAYFESVPLGNRLSGLNSDPIRKGWETWQKYEKHFPHPRYLIFSERVNIHDTVIHTIYFLDKAKTIAAIKQHQALFQKELNLNIDAQHIISNMEQNRSMAILNNHEGLLGILLGYGEESAMKYHKRNLIWKIGLPLYDELQPTPDLLPYFIPPSIQPIQFVGNPQSPEVISIQKQNHREQEQLLDIYSQGNFLEITLARLMQHN